MRFSWMLFLLALHGYAGAALLPEGQRQELIKLVLENFWGRAKLSDGKIAQPASEAERNTVPISNAVANRALDAGEVSGLGEWCKLDWEPHYLALTRAARAKGLTDKQVAFISFLHGAAQGRVASAMAKSACTEPERQKVQPMLDRSKARGLEGN